MTTALLVISLFLFVLSMISTTIALVCCGTAIRLMKEIQEMYADMKKRNDQRSLSKHLIPDAWQEKYGMNN